eukprot:15355415-Ditylum_brightwellii.AAC.1
MKFVAQYHHSNTTRQGVWQLCCKEWLDLLLREDDARKQGMRDQVLSMRRVVIHEDIKTMRAIQAFLLFRAEREVTKHGRCTLDDVMVPLEI